VKVMREWGRSVGMHTEIPAGCIVGQMSCSVVGQVGGRWSVLLLTEFHGGGCYTGT